MRLRSAAALAVLAILLATAPEGVSAASPEPPEPRLRASYPCYGSGESLLLSGSGFAPQGSVALSVSGQQLATVGTDPDGSFTARVQSPGALFGTIVMRFTATDTTDRSRRAGATVRIATTDVVVTPAIGGPARVRRIRGWGFFDARVVYAHIKRHGARRARNIRLGAPRGACGRLDVERRLFSSGVRPGAYTLQFDTLRRYYPNLAAGVSYVVAVFGPASSRASTWPGSGLLAAFARTP